MRKLSLYILFIFITITACSIDSKCDFNTISPIIDAQGPESILLGETITFQLLHEPETGCSTNRDLEVFVNQNILFIRQLINVKCDCFEEPEVINSSFQFTPTEIGTYTFRFESTENSTIIRNVEVE